MNLDELRDQLELLAGPPPLETTAARAAVARRVRRSRRNVSAGSAIAGVLVIAIVAVGVRRADEPSAGVRTVSSPPTSVTAPPAVDESCAPGVATVPADDVPSDVRAWAGGKAVIGGGALWTVRSGIIAVHNRQPDGSWLLKFPWLTRPFGLPRINGRRLDGQGTFRADANEAIDQRGKWVVSSLEFSTAGCWEVTARFDQSTITFRLLVGDPPRPLNIGTITATLRAVGGPAPGENVAIPGTIRIFGAGGVWEFPTNRDGRISVDVPVGSYTLTGSSSRYLGGLKDACGGGRVIVVRGRTANDVVVCPVK